MAKKKAEKAKQEMPAKAAKYDARTIGA